MVRSLFRRSAKSLCALLLGGALCAAQEGGAPVAPSQPGTAPAKPASTEPEAARPKHDPVQSGGISERLEIYWVVDADGELQPLLNVPLEEIENRLRDQPGLDAAVRPAPYTTESLSINGTAGKKNADLTVHLKITVRAEDWVAVPLRFDRAIMKAPAEHVGGGEALIQVDPDGHGYIAYLRGEPGQQHELTLSMLVPLTAVGRETRLKLRAPQATVSDLALTVPLADAQATVSDGATLAEPEAAGEGATRLSAQGVGGEFQLAWKEQGKSPQVPVQLEVVGAVLTRIGSRSVEADATLTVRSYGAPFDGFDVRLPPGARLAEARPPIGCTIDVLEDVGNSKTKPQVVAVRLEKPTDGPLEVGISTARPHHVTDPAEAFDIAGFEVPGAVRQWGHIAVAAISDWQVDFGAVRGVVRTDDLPEALRDDELVAGYEYVGQPYSLPVNLGPRKTRVSVEPDYQLLVDPGRMGWDASLKYTIRGAKAFELSVELPDWEPPWILDKVGPANLVDVDRAAVLVDEGKPPRLWIPLRQAATGMVEIQFQAHRLLADQEQVLSATLPRPVANSSAPAALKVTPAQNVRLVPDDKAIVGLTRQTAAELKKPGKTSGRNLSYRAAGPGAKFVADYAVQSRQITVEVASRIEFGSGTATVQQDFDYTIAFEPAGHLEVDVPRDVADLPQLAFQFDGQPLEPTRPSGERAAEAGDEGDSGDGLVRMQLLLPEARLGNCRLSVRYPITMPPMESGTTAELALPLVMPTDGELAGNRLQIQAEPEWTVASNDPLWSVSVTADEKLKPTERVYLQAGQRVSRAVLTLTPENDSIDGATVVERAWVQTWLNDKARQDRAVFALRSDRRELRLHLPAGVGPDQIQLRLDGRTVNSTINNDGSLDIRLPNDGAAAEHLLELRLRQAIEPRHTGQIHLELPHLDTDIWIHRMYWQLVLPQYEHVLTTPAELTGEFRWDFDRLVWRREPLMKQAGLEAWIGAPVRTPAAVGTNQYLFGSLGGVASVELRTADRSWIVLVASGAALVVGLLLIYMPRSRHPGTLLVAAVAMLTVGMIWPEPTVLFAQAAILGLGLTLLAGLLERGVARRRQAVVFPAPPPSAVLEEGSSDTMYHPRPGGSSAQPSTTPPAPTQPGSSIQQ